MQRVGSTGRRGVSRCGRKVALTVPVISLLALSACTSGDSGNGRSPAAPSDAVDSSNSASASASSSSAPKPAVAAAVITALSADAARAVNPTKPVTVKVANGKLTSVKLVNSSGRAVAGSLAGDGSSWHSTEVLGYSKTYRLTATAQDAKGLAAVKQEKITTLTPSNMTLPYLNTVAGSSIDNGATYGVGMVAAVHFDESIPDKAAAEKALTVTTSPHVDGAWYWTDDTTAHWRPRNYYTPGTKVSITAKVYGVDLGNGLYGQSDESTSFTIGAKRLSVADAKTHQVKVYFDDKLVRTMPTSMGQGGYVQGKNGKIALWTMPGIYTVLTHENPAIMSSDSYGLPASSPYGYAAEKVYWSTKISTDGIYLHELDTTLAQQGHENVSHGCLNLNYTNAHWFYNHSRVGDVVQVVHSGGPGIQVWQGGDWSVPWSTWAKDGVS